ncbi:MAG: sugar transferase [Paludibacter sp.]|nr:sugar transferase [Paludibacter sp.]
MYKLLFKRICDFTISLMALLFFFPVISCLIIILYFTNKGTGVFFVQPRPGRNQKIFKLIKFKTMTDEKNIDGNLLPDEQRLTKTGRLIRSLSLDELPQLLNVIKGDMSLVGPRPLLVHYLPLYNEQQAKRHTVRPGITGWAQVNGRNAINWQKKFEFDVYYVENISLNLDLKIIFLTIKKVFLREGINAGENIPMGEFKGN